MYVLAKEMSFDVKAPSNKCPSGRSLIKLPKSPAIMALGISTIFLTENPNELIDRLKFLLQEIQAGINFNIIDEEIIATADKLLENKCISTKQHKQILIKCNLLHIKEK